MHIDTIISRLAPDARYTGSRYALIECAATSGFDDDDEILKRLNHPDIEKHILFTGEESWTLDHLSPYLLPLDSQPELARWLLANGWGKGWGVFFASRAKSKTLLAHLRSYLDLEAPNRRDVRFRFFDPLILGDFLSTLSPGEAVTFFGPIDRIVMENSKGEPVVFDKPRGAVASGLEPSALVFGPGRRDQLAWIWRKRLLDQHVATYKRMGIDAIADVQANALTLRDPCGTTARLQKTKAGVETLTGEQRRFQYELTSCKHPAGVIDPAGNRIELDIQERDNKNKINSPPMLYGLRMDNGAKTWVFDYDNMHHLTRIDHPDGGTTQLSHDSYGNPTGIVDCNGNASKFEYDFYERLTRFKDANGQSTRFNYEELNAPASISFADGAVFGFEYTDAGALATFLAGDTRVADYQVDPESGSWSVNYVDGDRAEFVVEEGKIVRATNGAGTVELTYDQAGHLVKESFWNRAVTYHRDETGRLTGITTPFGQKITYQLDKENRVSAIKAWSGRKVSVHYALNGALEQIVYPNGTRLGQQTNAQGLPVEMHLSGPEGTLFYTTIERDKLDRVTRISDGDYQASYHYDPEGRLLEVRGNLPNTCETFTMDAKANRLADTHTHYRVNAADRVTQMGNTPLKYDGLGNLTRGICPGRGRARFAYTGLNRLESITFNNSQIRYRYDAFGRRVAKTINGVTTHYYWASSQLLHEARTTENPGQQVPGVIDYLFFPQTPVLLAMRQEQIVCWAAFGHRYEVLGLTNEGGQLVWHARYNAFGQARVLTGDGIHQPFRLPGQYHDEESGLHYNLARYYDPNQGRFLTLDPLFFDGGGRNFYTYCNGDPINHIDPCGEFIFCAILIGAAIGAAIGGGMETLRQHRREEKSDGFKIARAALLGGLIGAIGGTVGAAVEAAAAAGALGSTLASSTLPALAGVGFLSGAGASTAEQCVQAQITGESDPLAIAKQALIDGVIGAGLSLVTFGAAGFLARRLRKIKPRRQPGLPAERSAELIPGIERGKAPKSARAKKKGLKNQDHSSISRDGDPVNSVTGEVLLTQSDFTLPGRIPLNFQRHYGSQGNYCGLFGPGWQSPADARLELDAENMVLFFDGSPGGAVFEKLPDTEPVMEASDGAELSATDEHYLVRKKSGLTFYFAKTCLSRVVKISDPSGNSLSFERDEKGALTRIRDNSGQCIRVACNQGRIQTMSLGPRLLACYRYDEQGHLVAAVDSLGREKRFYYRDGRLVRHTDKNKLSFYYEYDDNGRCIHSWGDNGLYDYTFEHRIYERSVIVTNSLGHAKTYIYDHDRLPVIVRDPAGAQTRYTYDDVGRVIKITDPLERATEYTYDEAGNLTEINYPDHTHVVYAYDEHNRPVQFLDANGKLWEQRFDEHGRLVEKINPLDERTGYAYTPCGDLAFVTDPEGRRTSFDYDERGLIRAVIDAAGNATHYQRDLLGNITALIDPQGRATRYGYDDKSRLIRAVLPSGAGQSFEWDAEDNLLSHTDPNGHQTRFEYGGLNEIIRRVNADGTTVTYQYDSEENLTGVTNEKGQSHRFAYDHAGRVIARTDFHGHTTRYTYDPAGQLIQSLDPLERLITYAYDPLGRLESKIFENNDREKYIRDAAGNLIRIDSPGAMAEFFHDAANRLIAEHNGEFSVEYQYDKSGRRVSRATDTNRVLYSYDQTGALSAVQINDHEPVTIERDALGRITTEHLSKYVKRTLTHNDDGLITHQSITGGGAYIKRGYTYDPSGNLIGKQDNQKGDQGFAYDPMGRVIQALTPVNQVLTYAYDPAGDLLEHMPDIGHGPRCARHNHTAYQFDDAGNLIERQNSTERTRFAWDAQNRLQSVRQTDETRITMVYDALNRRRIKSVNGERTFYHYDQDTLLTEQLEDGPIREYVYYPGTFEPLALIDGDGQVYYYHNDPNGLPQELTKPNGDTVWSAAYDALGRVRKILVDQVAQPLRLQGQYFDEETGLCYNRHRYYDPQICSFISQDPLGLAAGENLYAMAPNVWSWADPLGLCPKKGLGDSSTSPWLADKRVGVVSHLEQFRDGGSWLMTQKQYEWFVKGNATIGDPAGQFIMPKRFGDKIFAESGGDLAKIEKLLGFPDGHFSSGGGLVRIDVHNPLLHNARLPSGMERGANAFFKWGGYTSGGTPEIVIDSFKASGATITHMGGG